MSLPLAGVQRHSVMQPCFSCPSLVQGPWNTSSFRQHVQQDCSMQCRVQTRSPLTFGTRIPHLSRARFYKPFYAAERHSPSSSRGSDSSSSSSSRDSQRRDSQYETSTSREIVGTNQGDMAMTDQDQRQRRPRGPLRRLLSFIAMTVRTVLLLPPRYGPHLPQKEARWGHIPWQPAIISFVWMRSICELFSEVYDWDA